MSDDNLDNIVRKVQGLIAVADDPATPPAASETYRQKAEALMFQYKIESLTAKPDAQVSRPVPVWKTIWVGRCSSEWRSFYVGLAEQAVYQDDIRHVRSVETNEEDGHRWDVLHAVGYESDLRYAEVLMVSAITAFGKHLEPKVDPNATDSANALRLRQGGMERRRIAMALFGGWATENEMKAKNRKVTNLIKKEAERIEQPQLVNHLLGRSGANIATYRSDYANSFYWTLHQRLRTKKHQDASEAQALVLASAKSAVEEEFYSRYPDKRPKAVIENTVNWTTERDNCKKCKKAKSGYCREHQWLKPSTAKGRDKSFSMAGYHAGAAAARTVDLGGSSRPTPIG